MKARAVEMVQPLRKWFATQLWSRFSRLQSREQRLLQLAGFAIPVMLLMFGVLLPIHDRTIRLQQESLTLASQAAEAARLADQLRRQPKKQASIADLLSGVEQLARSGGIRQQVTRIRPRSTLAGGEQVNVQIKKVAYSRVIPFIGQLNDAGIRIAEARFDAADAPGMVDVDLTLQR